MSLITLPGNAIAVIGGHGLTVPVPLATTIELLHCEIAGTGHHCDEESGHRLVNAPVLALVREPNNEHDADAIAVHLEGRKVGYIPRRHNPVRGDSGDEAPRTWLKIVRVTVE